jgi:YHS domain-containing protein
VPEGSCGTTGQVMRAPDILKLVTRPYREARKGHAPASAPGSAIDPICGMTVVLTDTAITYEHAGATYAFCCEGCRELFVEQLGA